MSLVRYLTLLCVGVGLATASSKPTRVVRRDSPSLIERDDPSPTICGDIIDYVNNGSWIFYASDAYECLVSVPFNAAVALRFVEYYNTTIQFQSTLAYLKSPPQGYQQPAVDVLGELETIKQNITAGVYPNQYAFEAALQNVVYRMHDAHVDLYSGILAAFTFASPIDLMTASKDGKEVPKVYFKDDVLAYQAGTDDISPVESINGVDVDTYLSELAALQVVGMLEPNADWNSIMSSPARDIQSELSILGGGMTFYPGDELNFTFANGSTYDTWWLALYSEPFYTGPLTTGGDFYNYFVLGLLPASIEEVDLPPAFQTPNDTSGDSNTTVNAYTPYYFSHAYPEKPDVIQQTTNPFGGIVTGYYLNDTSTGVLSIPTFDQVGWDIGNSSQAVADFINGAHKANLSHVIIDLQTNEGGIVLLAFVMFKQFFPNLVPFAGSRRRSHELANVLGKTFTDYYQGLSPENKTDEYLQASEWVVANRLNADTGRNFTSWEQYYGPRNFHGDHFSLTERYDLANPIFDAANFDGWLPIDYIIPPTSKDNQWEPEDIVILTDGICSSTCALVTEMFVQAGVRTVSVGGRPASGPMQAAAGSRGAASYGAEDIDEDFTNASNLSTRAAAQLPQVRDSGVFVNYAGFNLRDQIHQNDTTGTPLQFQYLPADCRLYFTLDNVYNMSALWRDVSHAVWVDSSLCVSGSTGLSKSSKAPPVSETQNAAVPELGLHRNSTSEGAPDPLTDGVTGPSRSVTQDVCDPKRGSADCKVGVTCKAVEFHCSDGMYKNFLCVPSCNNHGSKCPNRSQSCTLTTTKESGLTTFGISTVRSGKNFGNSLRSGICTPVEGTTTQCSTKNGAVKIGGNSNA